jgi:hypothetical protein
MNYRFVDGSARSIAGTPLSKHENAARYLLRIVSIGERLQEYRRSVVAFAVNTANLQQIRHRPPTALLMRINYQAVHRLLPTCYRFRYQAERAS